MIKVYPSLIAANQLRLEEEIKKVEEFSDGFHIDIMDFHFVPNQTMGPEVVNEIRKVTDKQLWIHLMVQEPAEWLEILNLQPNDIFTFHYEAKCEPKNLIKEIRNKNLLPSLALNPEGKLDDIFDYLCEIDQVTLMSVHPGFYGQKFIENSIEKIKALNDIKNKNNFNFRIGVDGGVNSSNIKNIVSSGGQDIVAGSFIFKSNNPEEKIKELKSVK